MKLTLSVLALSVFSLPAWANIVQNSGFETRDFTSWTASTTSDHPWGVTTAVPTVGAFSASTGCVGQQCITGTATQLASLSQGLTTVAGQNYVLSFLFTTSGAPNELQVLFGNTVAFDLVNTPNTGPFVQYSTTVNAVSNFTVLTFLGRQDPGGDRLDSVTVNLSGTAAPEPSTFLLLGGLLPVALAIRRRVL